MVNAEWLMSFDPVRSAWMGKGYPFYPLSKSADSLLNTIVLRSIVEHAHKKHRSLALFAVDEVGFPYYDLADTPGVTQLLCKFSQKCLKEDRNVTAGTW
jgi:hypothetical protein